MSGQKALMYKSFSSKITRDELAASIALMERIYPIIAGDAGIPQQQRKEAIAFVCAWKEWASGLAARLKPQNAEALLRIGAADSDADAKALSLHRNFLSVLDKCGTLSDGTKFIPAKKAEEIADFMGQLRDRSVMNFYQLRLLVAGMLEVAVGQSPPDGWIFKFASAKDASDFASILGSLPGFEAKDVRQSQGAGACTVTFSLSETGKSGFTVPSGALRTGASRARDGAVQKAAVSQVTYGGQATSVPYLTDKGDVLASQTADNPSSFMKVSINQVSSAALLYGEGYETDEQDSKYLASTRAKQMLYDLAKRFGFRIEEPFETWIASSKQGGGQEFLSTLARAKITLDVTGSADMAVFFDGKNQKEFSDAAGKNQALAEKRAQLVITYLSGLNSGALKDCKEKISFSSTPKGRVHFFQDFSDAQAKELGLGRYGYVKGAGAANMAALMGYLKAASSQDYIKVGQSHFYFTAEEQSDAAKFHAKLSKAVNADGTLAAGSFATLNSYFRRMYGDPSLRGRPGARDGMIYEGKTAPKGREQFIAPNVFARAIMESTEVSSRSVSLSGRVEAQLGISVKAEGGKAVPAVSYAVNGVPVAFNDQNGTVETYFENGRAMGVACTLDGTLNSGFAWQSVQVQQKAVARNTVQTDGTNVPGRRNEYNTIPFYAINTVAKPGAKPYAEKVDVRVAFVAQDGKGAGLGFLSPGRNAVRNETCYSVAGKEIAVVRGVAINGKQYSKDELLGLLGSKTVGFIVQGSLVALDGTTEIMPESDIPDGWARQPDGSVSAPKVKASARKVVVREGLESGQEFGKPREFHKDEYLIPYYVILPEKDVQFGKSGSLTAAKIRRLARQGYTAFVREENGDAFVFDLNGRRLGSYQEADEEAPKIKGIYAYVPKDAQVASKKPPARSDQDAKYWFDYPQKVYGPSDASFIHGIIKPLTRFHEEEVK